MTIKAQTVLEEGTGVVDQCVDATQLLECLNAASNEEPTSALDTIVLQKVAPGASTSYNNGRIVTRFGS